MENDHIKDDIGRLREIAQQGSFQQSLQLLPIVSYASDRPMNLFHEIMINNENGERNFKDIVEEFLQLIEKKLANAEIQMFDATYVF
jgi:GTPase SAR1 family protein